MMRATTGTEPTREEGAPRKKASLQSGGMLGCIKERITQDMFEAVPGKFKVLVCDKLGAEIISSCFRIHELMDLGITLVEDLFILRQPVINSPALYFIAPDREAVDRVMQDWRRLPSYASCHVFFTNSAPDSIINQLAAEQKFVDRLATCKDMFIDFTAPERLCFHFNMIGDLNKLFPPEDCPLRWAREHFRPGGTTFGVGGPRAGGRPTHRAVPRV
ncbi:syntaxin binding protein [Angomonas deanei]|nr:syntaxin binding protein [Angomonas deanei]|eukprot:EPY31494.1 syntaxin binding protein [Angomonas deanei]